MESPKQVLFVYDGRHCIDSGVSSYMSTLTDYLQGQNVKANLLVGKNDSADERAISAAKTVTIATNGTELELPLPVPNRKIWKVLEDLEPDVLHVQAPYVPTLAGRIIEAADPATRVIGTFHTEASTPAVRLATRIGGLLNRKTMAKFNGFFSVSETAQATANDLYGLETEVLPCPINLEEYKAGEKLPEYDDGRINLLFLGRLEERKGCDQLLGATALLDAGLRRNIRLIIAGDGYARAKLQDQAKRLQINDTVEFIGRYEGSKPDLLASADIACFPSSMGESFGIVLAEAMAAGAPVIAGANRGYSQTLGYDPEALFDPSDPSQLARKIETLLTDDRRREQLKSSQQEQVRNFDVAALIGPRMLDAYGLARAER